jgi:hypothetical protein
MTYIFWNITPLKVNQRYGGVCLLLPQVWRISQATYQKGAGSKHTYHGYACLVFHACFLPGLLFNPETRRYMNPRNVGFLSADNTALHSGWYNLKINNDYVNILWEWLIYYIYYMWHCSLSFKLHDVWENILFLSQLICCFCWKVVLWSICHYRSRWLVPD